MIASWMLYGVTVSSLVVAAAYALEKWVQARGGSIRWIWVAALCASVLVPIAAVLTQGRVVGVVEDSGLVGSVGRVAVGQPIVSGSGVDLGLNARALAADLDPILAGVWILGSLLLISFVAVSAVRLRLRSREWPEEELGNRRVRISADTGPAVIGFLRSEIVVPAWALEADEHEREMIVAHEEEHIRGRDPQLLLGALCLLAALPWNLPLWWAAHRLRLAIEIDCDARVLARGADVRAYGILLLDVSGHRSLGWAPALSNPVDFLERRIRLITARRKRPSWKDPFIAGALALLLLLPACEVDPPARQTSAEGSQQQAMADSGYDELAPVLAPRTIVVPPEILEPPAPDQTPEPRPTAAAGNSPRASVPTPPAPPIPVITSDEPNPSPSLTQPPGGRTADISENPVFTPMEVRPTLRNQSAFIRALEQRYPAMLKDAGIGGTTTVHVFIDERGQVLNARISQSSGYEQLDRIAEDLFLEVAEFTPAMNQDRLVPVWISLPVTFRTNR